MAEQIDFDDFLADYGEFLAYPGPPSDVPADEFQSCLDEILCDPKVRLIADGLTEEARKVLDGATAKTRWEYLAQALSDLFHCHLKNVDRDTAEVYLTAHLLLCMVVINDIGHGEPPDEEEDPKAFAMSSLVYSALFALGKFVSDESPSFWSWWKTALPGRRSG